MKSLDQSLIGFISPNPDLWIKYSYPQPFFVDKDQSAIYLPKGTSPTSPSGQIFVTRCKFIVMNTICSRGLDQFNIENYYINWVKTTLTITVYIEILSFYKDYL